MRDGRLDTTETGGRISIVLGDSVVIFIWALAYLYSTCCCMSDL